MNGTYYDSPILYIVWYYEREREVHVKVAYHLKASVSITSALIMKLLCSNVVVLNWYNTPLTHDILTERLLNVLDIQVL